MGPKPKKTKRAAIRRQSKNSEPPSPPPERANSESDSAPDSQLSGQENDQPPSPAPSNTSVPSHLHKEEDDDAIPPSPSAEDENNDSDKPTLEGEDQTSTKTPPESPSTPNPQNAIEGGETAESQNTLEKEPTKESSSTSDSEKTTEEPGDLEESDGHDAIQEPKPAAPTPPTSSPQLSERIQPEPIGALLDELQSAIVSPSMATAQVQGVPDTPLSLHSRSQSPSSYPRGAPSEHFASTPPAGYHQRHFSQSQPSASPFNFYSMAQPNGYPNGNPYAMQPHHPAPPYQHYGSFSNSFAPFGTSPSMQRHNSIASRGSNPSEFHPGPPGMENASAIDDDHTELFAQVSSAIPHLHRLLSRYKETHGQLGEREELIRRAEAEQADMIKRKDNHIDQVSKELEELKKSHSSETTKLRLEIGNREEHEKELEEQVAKLTEKIAKLEEDKKALEAANEVLESQKAVLEQEKIDLEKSVTEEKERLTQEFENWKAKAHETFETDKMALAVEFDKKLKEQETSAENRLREQEASAKTQLEEQEASAKTRLEEQEASAKTQLEEQAASAKTQLEEQEASAKTRLEEQEASAKTRLEEQEASAKARLEEQEASAKTQLEEQAASAESLRKEQEISAEKQRVQAAEESSKEKEALRADFQRQKQDLEDSFEKVRKEIETKLAGVQNDLDEALKTEREGREAWRIERENLIKGHQDERDSLHKGWDDQRELMLQQHKSTTDGLHEDWTEKHAQATTLADEERRRADQLEKERDDLQMRWEEEKRDRERAFNELKTVAENLGTEKGKLEKLIHAFGDVTDIKSKGDAY